MPELPLRYSGIILSSALYSACTCEAARTPLLL
jgi:hypothetical protein